MPGDRGLHHQRGEQAAVGGIPSISAALGDGAETVP